jgi:prepilin-type N-terminal cleavage/methylation domain-containing protein
MRALKNNQAGFSLLETLVASSIVAIAAYYVVNGVTNTLSVSVGLNDRLLANQIVQERISKMKNLAGYYVPIADASDTEGFYAGCFSKRGVATKNDTGTDGEMLVFGKKAGTPSGKCTKSEVEVQFQADKNDSAILRTYIIVNSNDKKTFSAHERELRLEKVL